MFQFLQIDHVTFKIFNISLTQKISTVIRKYVYKEIKTLKINATHGISQDMNFHRKPFHNQNEDTPWNASVACET